MWKLTVLGPWYHHLDRSKINRLVHSTLDVIFQSVCYCLTISAVVSCFISLVPALFTTTASFLLAACRNAGGILASTRAVMSDNVW